MDCPKVLIVDDDVFILNTTRFIVSNNFPDLQTVDQCMSVKEATRCITADKPDILLLDIQLEDGYAFDILDKINPNHYQIVFMSSSRSCLNEATRYNAIDYIKKPFNESNLIKALNKAIEAHSEIHLSQ